MNREPIYEKSITLPFGFSIRGRARPSTLRRTVVGLLPWALWAVMPGGKLKLLLPFAIRALRMRDRPDWLPDLRRR